MSFQPCPVAADCEDWANSLSLSQLGSVNVNRGKQGANISNSQVNNLTINIMGRPFEKRKIFCAAITILVLTIVGIFLYISMREIGQNVLQLVPPEIPYTTSTSSTSLSTVSERDGKFSLIVPSEIALLCFT